MYFKFQLFIIFFLIVPVFLISYLPKDSLVGLEDSDIFIDVKSVHSTSKSTINEFTISDGEVKGYFLEREGGTAFEELIANPCKRILHSIYQFIKNDCSKYGTIPSRKIVNI